VGDTADPGVLQAFDRAIAREAHNLSRWPELTWQQLYNRLQWEGPSIEGLLGAAQKSGVGKDRAWLRAATPIRDSAARTLRGHTRWVDGCAVSADGSFIASASSSDGTVKLWNTDTGEELRTLRRLTDEGYLKVLLGRDPQATIRPQFPEAATEEEVIHALARAGFWFRGCVAPDNSFVVSVIWDQTLKLWDATTGDEVRTLRSQRDGGVRDESHRRKISDVAIAPDGTFIVSASEDNTVKVWDSATGEEVHSLQARNPCAVAPDGSLILAAGEDNALTLWDPATGQELGALVGHTDTISCCAVSADGSFAVSGGLDNTLKLWDLATGAELRTLQGHTEAILDCAVAPDNSFVVSASMDASLKIWDAGSNEEAASTEHTGAIHACAVAPDGTFVVSSGGDRVLNLWDPATGAKLRTLTGHASRSSVAQILSKRGEDEELIRAIAADESGDVYACAVAPDSSYVVSAGWDRVLKLWRPDTGEELMTLEGHREDVKACAVAPDGSYIASADSFGEVKLWNPITGEELRTFKGHRRGVNGCAVAPDGRFVVTAGEDKTLKLWDPVSGAEIRTLLGHTEQVHACAVAPDGSFVVSFSWDSTLKLWDPATGSELRTLSGHSRPSFGDERSGAAAKGCAVSPDGCLVGSAGYEGTLGLWDVTSGEQLASVALPGSLRCVSFHPSEPSIVCGDAGGNLYFLSLVGITYGPIVVTAVGHRRSVVRCPNCRHSHGLDEAWLGQVIDCPTPSCDLLLRVNPFVVGSGRRGFLGRLIGRSHGAGKG